MSWVVLWALVFGTAIGFTTSFSDLFINAEGNPMDSEGYQLIADSNKLYDYLPSKLQSDNIIQLDKPFKVLGNNPGMSSNEM